MKHTGGWTPSTGANVGESAERSGTLRFVAPHIRDARWILGVLLLITGILGTMRVISTFDDTVQVWSAKRTLLPGEKVTSADVVARDLSFAGAERVHYLPAGGKIPAGQVVQHVVGKGELIPRSALATPKSLHQAPLTIHMRRGQADSLRPGTQAELWRARRGGNGGSGGENFEKPEMVVDRATVKKVHLHQAPGTPPDEGSSVEVFVPKTKVAELIEATNGGARLTLVPTGGEDSA